MGFSFMDGMLSISVLETGTMQEDWLIASFNNAEFENFKRGVDAMVEWAGNATYDDRNAPEYTSNRNADGCIINLIGYSPIEGPRFQITLNAPKACVNDTGEKLDDKTKEMIKGLWDEAFKDNPLPVNGLYIAPARKKFTLTIENLATLAGLQRALEVMSDSSI